MRHPGRYRQRSLFPEDRAIREQESGERWQEEPGETVLWGMPPSRAHLLGTTEMRALAHQPDRYPYEQDMMCGFRYRAYAFEYVARLYELLAYRWVLDEVLSGRLTEEEGGVEQLMPWVFEQFCARLPLLVWDCWSETTPHSNDRGLDGLILRGHGGDPIGGVQAKYYTTPLMPSAVREFYGALATARPPLKQGFLVTTSSKVPVKPIKMEGVVARVLGRQQVLDMIAATRLLARWIVPYAGFVVDGGECRDAEWQAICARLFVLRTTLAGILAPESGWPLNVRREEGLTDEAIARWSGVPFADLC